MADHPARDRIAPVINWCATSATLAYIFVWWHTWNYDRWRCLVFRRDDWFRTFILYVHIVGCTFFVASTWMDVHVVYQQVSPRLRGTVITRLGPRQDMLKIC